MKKKNEFPVVSAALMAAFVVLGSLLMCLPHGAPLVWGMDFASFCAMYGGYLFIILACIFHAKTNR